MKIRLDLTPLETRAQSNSTKYQVPDLVCFVFISVYCFHTVLYYRQKMRVILLLLSLSSTAASCNTVNGLNQNYTTNTKRIQDALNKPSPCVIVPAGDYPVKMIQVKSDTRLILSEGARLINIINITLVSIVQVGPNANNVQIEGPGTLYGSSDLGWDYYSVYDNPSVNSRSAKCT